MTLSVKKYLILFLIVTLTTNCFAQKDKNLQDSLSTLYRQFIMLKLDSLNKSDSIQFIKYLIKQEEEDLDTFIKYQQFKNDTLPKIIDSFNSVIRKLELKSQDKLDSVMKLISTQKIENGNRIDSLIDFIEKQNYKYRSKTDSLVKVINRQKDENRIRVDSLNKIIRTLRLKDTLYHPPNQLTSKQLQEIKTLNSLVVKLKTEILQKGDSINALNGELKRLNFEYRNKVDGLNGLKEEMKKLNVKHQYTIDSLNEIKSKNQNKIDSQKNQIIALYIIVAYTTLSLVGFLYFNWFGIYFRRRNKLGIKCLIIDVKENVVIAKALIDEENEIIQIRKFDKMPLKGVMNNIEVDQIFEVSINTMIGKREFIYTRGRIQDIEIFKKIEDNILKRNYDEIYSKPE